MSKEPKIQTFVRIRQYGKRDDLEPLVLGPSFRPVEIDGEWRVVATNEWMYDLARAGVRTAVLVAGSAGFLLGALLVWVAK